MPPSVAVITPYVGEPQSIVDRCVQSLAAQQCPGVRLSHIVVSDGAELPKLPSPSGALSRVQGIRLPERTGDGGATPRAVGSAFAIGGLGVDALAFLDVDNCFTPDHIATMVALAGDRVEVVSAKRWLTHHETGERMKVDVSDSDGVDFTDPSCIFLANGGLWLARLWGDPDPQRRYVHNTMQDRHYWEILQDRVLPGRRVVAPEATVEYRTPWLGHYSEKGAFDAPKRAKVLRNLADGSKQSIWVEVIGREENGWKVRVPK